MFYIASHIGQTREKPRFFPFEERKNHDIDEIARQYINLNLGLIELNDQLKKSLIQKNVIGEMIYFNYNQFKQQFDACVNRLLELKEETIENPYTKTDGTSFILEENSKKPIKEKFPRCLCCDEGKKNSFRS